MRKVWECVEPQGWAMDCQNLIPSGVLLVFGESLHTSWGSFSPHVSHLSSQWKLQQYNEAYLNNDKMIRFENHPHGDWNERAAANVVVSEKQTGEKV